MIKHHKLDERQFPDLLEIKEASAAHYFISRTSKGHANKDYMPVGKVEDLFNGKPSMLIDLCINLIKRGLNHQAKGIFLRNKLESLPQCAELAKDLSVFEY